MYHPVGEYRLSSSIFASTWAWMDDRLYSSVADMSLDVLGWTRFGRALDPSEREGSAVLLLTTPGSPGGRAALVLQRPRRWKKPGVRAPRGPPPSTSGWTLAAAFLALSCAFFAASSFFLRIAACAAIAACAIPLESAARGGGQKGEGRHSRSTGQGE